MTESLPDFAPIDYPLVRKSAKDLLRAFQEEKQFHGHGASIKEKPTIILPSFGQIPDYSEVSLKNDNARMIPIPVKKPIPIDPCSDRLQYFSFERQVGSPRKSLFHLCGDSHNVAESLGDSESIDQGRDLQEINTSNAWPLQDYQVNPTGSTRHNF